MSEEATTFPQRSAPSVGRTLPHSLESEEYLLSCCMLDGAAVIARCIMAGITPLSFYDTKHAIIFETLLALYATQRPTDASVVAAELVTHRQLDSVGGYAFITQVTSRIPTTAQAGYFIDKVREQFLLREVIRSATGTVEDCYNFSGGIDEFIGTINDRMAKVTGHGLENAEESFQKNAEQLLAEVTTPEVERKGPVGEVSWGLVDLDRQCGKLSPGNLIVIAGMPSTGKSAIADQVAWGAAAIGLETLVFTYEMTKREKAIRMAQQVSHLNYDQFYTAPADRRAQFTAAVRAISECQTLHVFERDTSVNRVSARVRAFANRGRKVGLVVVDFLQYLARMEPYIGKERTDEKIGRLTAALKNIARECACPVMLLSSLNRDGYRDGNRPTMASLRASGEIESDADVVAILHWPKENPATRETQDAHDSGQNYFYVEFNQDKGRNKGVHQIGLTFDRHATRFENYCR